MRILINENKLEKVIINFLDGYVKERDVHRFDSFIVIYTDTLESEMGDPETLMEYDYYDGRLYIHENMINILHNLFGMSKDEVYKVTDKWFEDKFEVEVNPDVR